MQGGRGKVKNTFLGMEKSKRRGGPESRIKLQVEIQNANHADYHTYMSHIHRLPFLRGATILNAALLVSSSRGVLADPFLATSLHPPPFVSERALVDTDSTMPLSASLRRRINSSANRRPSSVCELAYTESEMISASAGRSCSCWTKSSTSRMLASVFQKKTH
jgi:hypothetical protein